MKLFGRSGGYWLFWISAVYLIAGLWSVFKGVDLVWLGPLFILFLSMPFWFPPLGRAINLDVEWDRKMFDFFRFKKNVEESELNVVKFPEPKVVPKIEPPAKSKPEEHYRVGFDTEGRTTLTLIASYGNSMTLSMTQSSCEHLIKMLRATYNNDFTPDDDPDGGLPIPEEDKKVA